MRGSNVGGRAGWRESKARAAGINGQVREMPLKGIEVTAFRPALLVGLYERKGGLAVMLLGLFSLQMINNKNQCVSAI